MARFRGVVMLAQAIALPKIGAALPKIGAAVTKNRCRFVTKNRCRLPKIGAAYLKEGTLLPLDQGTTNFIGQFPSK